MKTITSHLLRFSILLGCVALGGCSSEDSGKKRDRDSSKKRRLSSIDQTQIVKVTKSLDYFYTQFISKTSTFPDGGDLSEKSPAGFAAWSRKALEWDEISFWYVSVASDVDDLMDDDASGMPEFIGDGDGGLDTDVTSDQKKAISWEIAIPKEGATSNLNTLTRKRGKFPIIWTKGLQSSGEWDGDSPWGGDGGHILWSDGTKEYYNNTSGDDEKGIFEDENGNRTKDINRAIPDDWEIIKPE
tara:strand:- start:37 stop:765 length:729 start_codon:yes stop_codon:yes gene_type:complete